MAVVGYTNAGKTSLLHALCRGAAGRLPAPQDALFATLDPAVRRAWLPSWGRPVLPPSHEVQEGQEGLDQQEGRLGGAGHWYGPEEQGLVVALSDTVGFIRDLPVGLVAAFR